MAQKVQFVVEAVDKASPTLDKIDTGVKDLSKNTTSGFKKMQDSVTANAAGFTALGVGAGLALNKVTGEVGASIDAYNKLQASMVGLQSIVKGTGNDFGKAEEFIKSFTKDGLMTTGEAATSLKNLLAKGFNLKEASDLMMRFKDAAAFGRQSALSLGEAVQGATEGIKNENSALVDNAGVTKNVAAMQEEYAKNIGKSYKDLTELEKRTAVYNGIMKETKLQVGDAAKAANTLAGQQAKLDAQTQQLRQSFGSALAPVMGKIVEAITPIIQGLKTFADNHPQVVVAVVAITVVVGGLTVALVALGFALGPIAAAFTAIRAMLAAIGAPILIAIAAVVALGTAYATNFMGIRDKTNEVFSYVKTFLSETWTTITTTLQSTWETIKTSFEATLSFLKQTWEAVWNGIKAVLEGILVGIGLALGLAFQLITGDFEGFLKNLSVIWTFVWNGIKAFAEGVWNALKVGLKVAWEGISATLKAIWEGIKIASEFIWNGIKAGILAVVGAIGFFFSSEGKTTLWNAFTGMFEGFGTFVSDLFNGIVNSIKSAINVAIDLINSAISAANEVPGVNFSTITPLAVDGARAAGGPVSSGNTYLVGERGPELFVPNRGGTIIPNNQLGGASGGNQVTINMGGVVVNNREDADYLANQVMEKITRQLQLYSRYGIS